MNVKFKKFLIPIIAISLLGYLFGWSSVFDIRSIEVSGIQGSKTLTSKKVITKSGIKLGDKLARVNAGAVARGLSTYPEVASVEINRKPLHTVEIVVTMREVDIAFASQNGKFLLGDRNGVTFVETSKPPKGVPIIAGDRRFIRDAMSIYDSLPNKIRKRVVRIELPSKASITLTLRGGMKILWGGVGDQSAKLTVLEALLAAPENKKARFIDIATPLTPTVRSARSFR
ncbi:MAG: cell division protein FtsQ/DivIB [Candidatus Nanopelagicaceae bacterium]